MDDLNHITPDDISQLGDQLGSDHAKIQLARTFLSLTEDDEKAILTPEILKEFGERLADPDALMAGTGVLSWQNCCRRHTALYYLSNDV